MIIDGTNGLTFNNATTQSSGGKVLQVVQASSATNYSTSSSSFVDSTFSGSITPLFATSKILVIANLCGGYSLTAGIGGQFTIYRNNATNLGAGGGTFNCLGFLQVPAANLYGTIPMTYLDSPATTSATTYNIYFATQSGSVQFNTVGTSKITLMEIAA
jgi:hypothetical protein